MKKVHLKNNKFNLLLVVYSSYLIFCLIKMILENSKFKKLKKYIMILYTNKRILKIMDEYINNYILYYI